MQDNLETIEIIKVNKDNYKNILNSVQNTDDYCFKLLFFLSCFDKDDKINIADIEEKTNTDYEKIYNSLNFLREYNVIEYKEIYADGGEPPPLKVTANIDRICEALENTNSFREFVYTLQQKFKKIYNPQELLIVHSVFYSYNMDERILYILIDRCVEDGHATLSSLERKVINLHDKGICAFSQYEAEYSESMKISGMESKVKEMFSLGEKKMTPKEKKIIKTWAVEYEIKPEWLKKAYDICMENLEECSVNYINAIVMNWLNKGYKTLEDVDNDSVNIYFEKNKKYKSTSFNLEEVFNKAVERGKN